MITREEERELAALGRTVPKSATGGDCMFCTSGAGDNWNVYFCVDHKRLLGHVPRLLAALVSAREVAEALERGCEYCANKWPTIFEPVARDAGDVGWHHATPPASGRAPCALSANDRAALARFWAGVER
jgi:hypothetical protein